ncbi:hypothetical protein HBN83_00075 [Pseudomonas fragi]|uniref:Pycsar system effector family protein n=1 Tax=Pseudomonas fragi TaxID=296 RepID=UPI0014749D78|nr:Pycsar system effector family protein [Pseudomonas fragi]NNB04291.1 hypothetical protein [Pseudomonas fragi]
MVEPVKNVKPDAEVGKINDEQKLRISSMWDSLKRFDTYIGSVNFKSGLLTTLNAAIFGGVVLKAETLVKSGSHYQLVLATLVALIALLSLASIYQVIKSIWPNLSSASTGLKSSEPSSIFFFASISRNFTASEYANAVKSISLDQLERDISIQVHEVAVITDLKFKIMSRAARFTSWNLVVLLVFGAFQLLEISGYYLCRG